MSDGITTLEDIDQDAYDAAEAVILQMLRENAPQLDLRRGTAIRDLLVRPAAQFHALNDTRIEELRASQSLEVMEASPAGINEDIADSILSNLAYERQTGSKSTGSTQFRVDTFQEYFIRSGYQVKDANGRIYQTTRDWTVRTGAVTDPLSEVQLITVSAQLDDYFFVLPMEADLDGTAYDVQEGEAFTSVSQRLAGVVEIEAYTSFTGGTDAESVTDAINNLENSLSHRAFESQTSINAKLRENFSDIYAVSAVGYANAAQLRDKHNLMGVAVGNKVDIYVRTYRAPNAILLSKTGTKVSDGVYTFEITPEEAAGFLRLRAITPIGTTVNGIILPQLPGIGSLPYTLVREATGLSDTFHDFGSDNTAVETAFSLWQKGVVTVTDVPAFLSGSTPVYPDEVTFRVELYTPPSLTEMQNYIDNPTVRNQEADQVARGAVPCFVTVQGAVFRRQSATVDIDAMTNSVADLINSKDFGESLPVSQVTAALHQYDIIRVALDDQSSDGLRLTGEIEAPDGTIIAVGGDVLDIVTVEQPELLVSPMTTVFTVDRRNIFLEEVVVGQ
jgi:hypothetical protein